MAFTGLNQLPTSNPQTSQGTEFQIPKLPQEIWKQQLSDKKFNIEIKLQECDHQIKFLRLQKQLEEQLYFQREQLQHLLWEFQAELSKKQQQLAAISMLQDEKQNVDAPSIEPPLPLEENKSLPTNNETKSRKRKQTGLQCPYPGCNHGFGRKFSLNRHIKIHTGHMPYLCEQCGKKFREKSSRQRHIQAHSGKKPFSCDHTNCDKTFADNANKKKHVKIVHEEPQDFTSQILADTDLFLN